MVASGYIQSAVGWFGGGLLWQINSRVRLSPVAGRNAMPEAFAAVLNGLAGQPKRLEYLRGMLDDPGRRTEFEDYIEEVARHESVFFVYKKHRRAEFYAEVLKREGERLKGHGQLEAIKTLDESLPSIFEALDTALDRADAELLLTFATHVGRYLDIVSRFEDAVAWYERLVVGARKSGNQVLLMHAHLGSGIILCRLNRYEEAENSLQKAMRLAEGECDRESIALALHNLGEVAHRGGRCKEGRKLLEKSLVIWREIGDRIGIATTLQDLSNMAVSLGSYANAKELGQESLAIKREIGDLRGIADSLNNMGCSARAQGNYDEARQCGEESLAIYRRIGNRRGIASCLNNLGGVACNQQRYKEAEKLHEENLAIQLERGDHWGIEQALYNLADVAACQGLYSHANALFRKSLAVNRKIGNHDGIACCLRSLAAMSIKQGRLMDAADDLTEALKFVGVLEELSNFLAMLITTGLLLVQGLSPKMVPFCYTAHSTTQSRWDSASSKWNKTCWTRG